MATHSGTLAWKIPWTEEPGRGCKESDMTERLQDTNMYGSEAWRAAIHGVTKSRT